MKDSLEEAATKFLWKKYPYHPPRDSGYWQDMFIEGAKWQQERSYSEKEVGLLTKMFNLYWCENNSEHEDNLEEWEFSKRLFEQFKKKV